MRTRLAKKLFTAIVLIMMISGVTYSIASNKINPARLADEAKAMIHYYKVKNSPDFEMRTVKGIPVFINRSLTAEEKEKIEYALRESDKTLNGADIKGLKMLVYTHIDRMPDYLKKNQNVSLNVSNNLTEGFYVTNMKEIYIFPEVIEKDSSFEQKDVMLYVTLHEIGHHIDLTINNNYQDENAEKRASITAFNKIKNIGIQLDEYAVNNIIQSR